jgi:hypothetical protein
LQSLQISLGLQISFALCSTLKAVPEWAYGNNQDFKFITACQKLLLLASEQAKVAEPIE